MHKPVLLHEALDEITRIGPRVVLDLTLGGGGYTRYLLERVPEASVIAFDCDKDAINRAKSEFKSAISSGRLSLVHANYSRLAEKLDEFEIKQVDAIVADLGFSSFQMDLADRGFSFRNSGPLDMRLNKDTELTAHEIVNSWLEKRLAGMIRKFGEDKSANRIAQKITEARNLAKITNTKQLALIVEDAIPVKLKANMQIHPATKTFQALRIQVNDELLHLTEMLEASPSFLREGGVLSIVSFHSLEDRLVKQRFRMLTEQCICENRPVACERCYKPPAKKVNRQIIIPSIDEISENPRSRSARLRMIVRTEHPILDPR